MNLRTLETQLHRTTARDHRTPRGRGGRQQSRRAQPRPRDNDKFIYSFKGGNVDRAVARRVHDAQRRLAIAERSQVRKPPAPLTFAAAIGRPDPASKGEIAVHVRDLRIPGWVEVATLDVPTGARLLLTGGNGSAKSNLLAMLDGRLPVAGGTVRIAAGSVGLLPQDVTFDDPAACARCAFQRGTGSSDAHALTTFGLLRPHEITAPVGALSIGQQRRLAFAILLSRSPELVLLDEPTNHISLALASELQEALGTSPATVVVASHDRWFRRRWDGLAYAMRSAADRTCVGRGA